MYEATIDLLNNIPHFKDRVDHVLEIYDFDMSTTRKRNKNFKVVMWEIIRFVDKHYCAEVPIENGDLLDWAIGYIDFEKLK